LKDKIKQRIDISELILEKNKIQIIKNEDFECILINCYYLQSINERKNITRKLKKYIEAIPTTEAVIIARDFNFVESQIDTKSKTLLKMTQDKVIFKQL